MQFQYQILIPFSDQCALSVDMSLATYAVFQMVVKNEYFSEFNYAAYNFSGIGCVVYSGGSRKVW